MSQNGSTHDQESSENTVNQSLTGDIHPANNSAAPSELFGPALPTSDTPVLPGNLPDTPAIMSGETMSGETPIPIPSAHESSLPPKPDEDATLKVSPQARRALLHIARRHMRHAHVVRRSTAPLPVVDASATPPMPPENDPAQLNSREAGTFALSAAHTLDDLELPPPLDDSTEKRRSIKVTARYRPTEISSSRYLTATHAGDLLPITPLPTGVPLSKAERLRLKPLYRRQYFSRKRLRHARVSDRQSRQRMWTTIWTVVVTLLLIVGTIGGIAWSVAYNFVNTTSGTYASQVLTLRDLLPLDNLKIYDSQNRLIDQLSDQGVHTTVTYNQVAPSLVDATVAIEDKTFWSNQGYDVTGILRAALANLQSGQPIQGGSTITQQLIKLLIVGNSDDALRKLSELTLAPQINNHYSKQDIMEMYLNTIYYGHQAYGIEAAAGIYFGLVSHNGKSAASQLDIAQSAFLAGLPRNAALYDPFTHTTDALNRFQDVLEAMVEQNYISRVQAQDAYQEALNPLFFKAAPTLQDQAPHFDAYVLTQLETMFHATQSQLSRSGLLVHTTLNITLQNKILKVMQEHIAEIRQDHHVTNAAEVLIDFHTGAIISMLGSIDYNDTSIDGQYNVALAYRQPGSSFKPYVYATAFAEGASPGQAVDDARTTYTDPSSNPPTYTPDNYDLHFHGQMTLRCALQNSLNVPAVRVLQHVGIPNAMSTAQAMGITSYQGTPGLSLVLGGLGVRLLDHTSAIGVFANGGIREPYYSISKVVQGTTGRVVFQQQPTPGTRVISAQVAYMMTNVLSDNTSRIPEFFDCNVLQLYSNSQQDCEEGNRGAIRPAAAKTGTTQDFRDNWTVGYTTDYVMGVWAGNDDNSAMIDVTGVQGAAPIWHDSMLLAEQGHPVRNFVNPGGLVKATVTYQNGVKSTDLYLPGTVPTLQPTSKPAGFVSQAATPYCSTYSFAFAPPVGGGIPANGDWW